MARPLLYSFTSLLRISLIVLTVVSAASCTKYEDTPGASDPRLSRKYCNDPEAVNFNRNFPGTEDNSTCVFPADAFKGTYLFTDSVFDGANVLRAEQPLTLLITAQTRTKLAIAGLCGSSVAVTFTATRTLRATADTTIVKGQALCRARDTVSGFISQPPEDSTRIRFFLQVVNDTGVSLHRGTAYRQ